MVERREKAEIQALSSFGFQYLSKVFLPRKIQEGTTPDSTHTALMRTRARQRAVLCNSSADSLTCALLVYVVVWIR